MLNLPISGVEAVLFSLYLGLWAGFLVGGFIFGKPDDERTRRMPRSTRLLSSFMLVLGAWTWFAVSQGTSVAMFAAWVAVGMTLGFIGDVFMAQVVDIQPHILYGMGAFGLGHIAYITGMMLPINAHDSALSALVLTVASWWAIAVFLWYLVVYRRSKPTMLVYAALPYTLLLATTVGVAMHLTTLDVTYSLVVVGAVLFLLSDLLLAAQLFSRLHFRLISDVVWFLYGPGQMLIVFGVILYTVIDSLHILP
ncbi:MAG: lysoplasmalogenase family protein [Anaerolineae bacterium]